MACLLASCASQSREIGFGNGGWKSPSKIASLNSIGTVENAQTEINIEDQQNEFSNVSELKTQADFKLQVKEKKYGSLVKKIKLSVDSVKQNAHQNPLVKFKELNKVKKLLSAYRGGDDASATLNIIAAVLGLLSWVLLFYDLNSMKFISYFIPFILGLASLILGIIGLDGDLKGLAIVGLILGGLMTGIWILVSLLIYMFLRRY